MRMFLCLKDRIVNKNERNLTAGKLYTPHGSGVMMNDYGYKHYRVDAYGVFVETFTKDNVTWIKHDGGVCPVPDGWVVDTLATDGYLAYSAGCAGSINTWAFAVNAYRIISTGEEEESGAGGGIEDSGHGENTNIADTVEVKSVYSDWDSCPSGSSTYYRSDSLHSVTDYSGIGWHNIEWEDKDESELNDDNPDMSMMDNLTPSQREYWNQKEYEQHQREQAEERARQDKIEHDKEVADSIGKANGAVK